GGVNVALEAGQLHIFDVTDPATPSEVLDPPMRIFYPPRDLAAGADDSGAKTLVIATSPKVYYKSEGDLVLFTELVSTPSQLFVYDVSSDVPQWMGAASLTQNILDGYPNRVVLKGSSAYVATPRKGIQVVDLAAARTDFPAAGFGPANTDPQ